MRQYIPFFGILFFVPLSVLATDCGELKDRCKRCKGDGYELCRFGTIQPLYQCGTGMTCIKGSDGCQVQCIHGVAAASQPSSNSAGQTVPKPNSAAVAPPKSSAQAPAPAGGECSTGNKGEVVPNGCGYCMGKSLLMKCSNGQWQSPKTCSSGEICKGGVSVNLKVACDGQCARA